MSSFDTRNNSAVMKRAEQLKRWEESDTNRVSGQPKNEKNRKIKFSSGCVFLAACLSGDKDEVVNLLETGADINTANVDGLTALHQACIDDNLEMVEFLIEHGADINRQDNEGWTPLHATASCGFVSIARYLVEHGADLRAVNSDGDLPVDIAHLSGMVEYMQNLVEEHGIDCESARKVEEQMMLNDAKKWLRSDASEADKPHPKTGATALHVAAAKGYTKVLGLLLAGRANVDKQDNDGWAPLHAAAHWCQKEAAEMLVDAMADMDIKNYAGQTCIDVADRKIIKFLEELRANNKRMKNRRPSSQIRISDAIENHNESGTPTKLIRVEVKSDSKDTAKEKIEDDGISNLERTLESDETDSELTDSTESSHSTSVSETEDEKSPRANNDSIKPATETADDDAPWRRGSTIRSRIPPENPPKTPQVNEKDVKSTDSDVILRRTQSFENDEKFYQKYHELRARIKANSCPTLPATQTPGVLGTVITPNQNYSVQRSASLIDHRHFRKPMSPAVNPNTPAAVPNTGQVRRSFVPPVRDEESETQRKAHAKRVRETRRSTQGVTLDEIKSAEELVKKKNLSINNNNNNNTSTESQNTTTTITSSTTTTTPSTQSSPPQASSATAATITTTTTTTTITTDNYLTNATTPTLSILTTPTTTTISSPSPPPPSSSLSLSPPITTTTTTTTLTTNTSPTTMNDQVSPSVYLNESSPSKLIAMEKSDRKDDVTASFTLKSPMKSKDASTSENDEATTTTTTTTTASYTISQQSSPKIKNLISNDDNNKDSKCATIITGNCDDDDDSINNSNSNSNNINNSSSSNSSSSSSSSSSSCSSNNINISKIVKNAAQQQLSPKKISISNVIDKTKTDEETDESSNANNIKKLITSNKNNNKMIDNNKLQNEMISHINDDNKSSSTTIIREKHRSLFDIDNANSLTLADKLRNEANKYYDDTITPITNSNQNSNTNENSNKKINSDNENDNDNKQTVVNVAVGANCKSTTNEDTDKDCCVNNISVVANRKCDSTPSSPLHHNMTERRPSWRLKFDAGCKFKLEDATSGTTFPQNNSTIISSAPAVIAAANLSSVSAQRRNIATNTLNTTTTPTNPTQRPLSAPTISSTIASNSNSNLNSNELIDLTNNEEPTAIRRNRNTEDKENDKENDGRSAMSTQAVIQRRRKPKRRSTGVVHIDIDDIDPERQEPNPDVDDKESGNERSSRSRVGSTTSSQTDPDHIGDKRKCANDSTENGELIDYKALWEAAKLENDKLKLQLKKKDDDIITAKAAVERFANATTKNSLSELEKRERRAMERKLSEMEEELKQLEAYKTENQRLKEENGALIRVISKLSK